LPLNGLGEQTATIDILSGMSTYYTAKMQNNLILGDLMSSPPGATKMGHHHPFMSLKVLHETLGDSGTLAFSTLEE